MKLHQMLELREDGVYWKVARGNRKVGDKMLRKITLYGEVFSIKEIITLLTVASSTVEPATVTVEPKPATVEPAIVTVEDECVGTAKTLGTPTQQPSVRCNEGVYRDLLAAAREAGTLVILLDRSVE